eukprot:TRINITY_DN195_c0_g2_i1.p1 TRINITY_DN195_c0_g2~~TRINITY_DN195_c0_g2_i1.p1  ORF type:complete len:458 (-),score=97.37 TRINITY_DN195_c0_g2_i1:1319-2638(-)
MMSKPARVQADADEVIDSQPDSAFYNIFYDKVEDFSKWHERRDAKIAGKRYKLDIEKDLGTTKADEKTAYLCLHFARGKCIHGHNCKYLHRLPLPEDERRLNATHDVFGREKHSMDRGDMGGVGSFNRTNYTLYVSGIRTSAVDSEKKIYEAFGVFGTISHMRLLRNRGLAFITYKERTGAEFAKEAMADQWIFGREAINVRWAHPDPNKRTQNEQDEELKRNALAHVEAQNPVQFQQEVALAQGVYPDTNWQYEGSGGTGAGAGASTGAGAGEGGEWVQVGDEASGYYWVYAGAGEEGDPEAGVEGSAPTSTGTDAGSVTTAEGAGEGVADESRQFQAFQKYYYENNYPYYYDENGVVIYYDPSLVDEQTRLYYESRVTPPTVPAQTPTLFDQTAHVPVSTASNDYFANFSGYSAEPQAGGAPVPPPATHAAANKPLY